MESRWSRSSRSGASQSAGRPEVHILWLKTELLHPVDKGGRIRTYQMLRSLARTHQVTYLSLDDGTAAPDAEARSIEYAHRLVRVPFSAPATGTTAFYADLARNFLSPLPYAIAKYRSAAFAAEVRRLAPTADVVVCDFLAPAVNVPEQLPVPTVLFQHNVEAEIWRRHAEVGGNPVVRGYFHRQWQRMLRFEAAACRRFDQVIAVSEADATLMAEAYGVEGVAAVPTGVDVEYFRPQQEQPRSPRELVFTGSMDWLPNEDGVTWFAEQVLPRVQAEVDDATFTVVGRNPSPKVLDLARRCPGVTVTGTVPDIRPYLARGVALVVPLRIGGGTRLKIFEAMAMGVPVISTTVGAEGLPLQPGTHLLEADTPEALTAACVGLLRDPAAAAALGDRGAQYVQSQFGWDRVAGEFAALCAQTAGLSPQRSMA